MWLNLLFWNWICLHNITTLNENMLHLDYITCSSMTVINDCSPTQTSDKTMTPSSCSKVKTYIKLSILGFIWYPFTLQTDCILLREHVELNLKYIELDMLYTLYSDNCMHHHGSILLMNMKLHCILSMLSWVKLINESLQSASFTC